MRKVDRIEYPLYKKRLKYKIKLVLLDFVPDLCVDLILSYTNFRWCLKKRIPRVKIRLDHIQS